MDNKNLILTDEEYAELKALLLTHAEDDFEFNYRGQVLTTHRSMSVEEMNTLGLNTEGNDGEPQFWIDLDPIADLEDDNEPTIPIGTVIKFTPWRSGATKSVVLYPEHEKLKAISDKSQAIGEFLDWLPSQGIALHDLNQCNFGQDKFEPVRQSIHELLAEYFQIDQKLIDQEKEAMLASIDMLASLQRGE